MEELKGDVNAIGCMGVMVFALLAPYIFAVAAIARELHVAGMSTPQAFLVAWLWPLTLAEYIAKMILAQG